VKDSVMPVTYSASTLLAAAIYLLASVP